MIQEKYYVPRIVEDWCLSISDNNPYQQLSFYSQMPVLLATFENMLVGRTSLFNYFVDFLDKKDMTCVITENITQIDADRDTQISSGLYDFTFIDENGELQKVKARYTFVVCQGKIITHHSSIQPN